MSAFINYLTANWEFILVAFAAAVSIMVNILIFIMTPAETFLRTAIRGGMNLMVIRKDRKAHIVNAKVRGGLAETKNYGNFIIIMKTVLNLVKGNTIGIAVEDAAFTIDKDVAIYTQVLNERGYNNLDDVLQLFEDYGNKHVVKEVENEKPTEEGQEGTAEQSTDTGGESTDKGDSSANIS